MLRALNNDNNQEFRESVAKVLDESHLDHLVNSLDTVLGAAPTPFSAPVQLIKEKLKICEGAYHKLSAIIPSPYFLPRLNLSQHSLPSN
ncbi:hypothetical protein PtA15_9A225 [Puccinia triticina]|uniref:Uncharacterized protein n=1 Tax=Puccinia triticina TaxID=208348 RepID=A0ABY7CWF4_9BASI|nr:uncharacterized protein PtA15_9A225 [Puccinia triticina]WAQ88100.1 hypothetical protein PtA15_9A225 [Puccinia triticina]WAR60289.1 hypothetical protein PtB15_9B226 [Puccinia triticina]